MLEQVENFRRETDVLAAAIRQAGDCWETATQFKRWTFYDVLAHLHLFNRAAELTLDEPAAFQRLWREIIGALSAGTRLTDYTRQWVGNCSGPDLFSAWQEGARRLGDAYDRADPGRRVSWAGPEMSVRSCISARQMETWAHGQAIFDTLGIDRDECDRIYNIVLMGVNTFAWSFSNRGLAVPASRPSIQLLSPGGRQWKWDGGRGPDRIGGSAVEFCQVVAQTRSMADTSLEVVGDTAKQWMSIAQCFAGPPEDPPAPGTRFRQPAPRYGTFDGGTSPS